jgi:hypothetical protein
MELKEGWKGKENNRVSGILHIITCKVRGYKHVY